MLLPTEPIGAKRLCTYAVVTRSSGRSKVVGEVPHSPLRITIPVWHFPITCQCEQLIGAVATIVKLWTVDNALITKDSLYSEVCLCSSDTLWSAGQRRRPARKNRHRASIHRNTLKSMRTHVHLSSIKRTKCALSEYSTSSTYEKKVV